MNTQEPVPGEQPEQDIPSTTTEVSEQPPSVNPDDYSAEELLAALTGEPEAKAPLDKLPEAAPSEQPEPKKEEEPEAKAPLDKLPEAAPSEQPEPKKEEEPKENAPEKKETLRLRFSALSQDQQTETAEAYRMVRDGEASDMLEAIQALRGVPASPDPAKAEDAAAEIPQSQEDAPPTEAEVITAQIADLRVSRKQAKKDFDDDAEEDFTTQIEDLTLKLAKAEAKAEAQHEFSQRTEAQSRKQWVKEYESAVDELEGKYPDVLDDNSTFTRFLDAKIKAAKADSDPRMQDPRYIVGFAAELADEIKAMAPKPSGAKPSPPPSAPRPNGSAVAPSQNTAQRVSDQQAAAMFYDESTSADEILAALYQ